MNNTPEFMTHDHALVDLDNMQDQRDLAMKVIKRLERERDEAREERDKMQAELEMWRDGNIMHQIHRDELEKVEQERDEAITGRQAYKQLAVKHAQERDEAREKLEDLDVAAIHSCHNECQRPMCVLRRERDESRDLAQQMSESNQVLMADVRFYRNAWEETK